MERPFLTAGAFVLAAAILAGCVAPSRSTPHITVAAASNLSSVCQRLGRDFEAGTGVHVDYSFAATGNLTRQIENDAPFDVFLAADVEHVAGLESKGLLVAGSRAVYARGRLVLWMPSESRVALTSLAELESPQVRCVAVAQPSVAPYGAAAVESLHALGLWEQVGPKIVYAESIGMAKQFAVSGNADACFTAYSLVMRDGGRIIDVPERLHRPLDQALAILQRSPSREPARRFTEFVLGPKGSEIFEQYGYRK